MSWAHHLRTDEANNLTRTLRTSINPTSTLEEKRKGLVQYLKTNPDLSDYLKLESEKSRDRGAPLSLDLTEICRLEKRTDPFSQFLQSRSPAKSASKSVSPVKDRDDTHNISFSEKLEDQSETLNTSFLEKIQNQKDNLRPTPVEKSPDKSVPQSSKSVNNSNLSESFKNLHITNPPTMNFEKLDEILQKIDCREKIGLEVEEFRGAAHEDISEHCDNVDRIARVNRWNEEQTIRHFSRKLKDEAKEFFMHNVLGNNNNHVTWAQIKEQFKVEYGKDENTWDLLINKTKQKTGDCPVAFARKIIRLCKKQNPNMSEKATSARVLNCLLPEQRKAIQNLNNRTIANLLENLEVVKDNLERYNDSNEDSLVLELKNLRVQMEKLASEKNKKETGIKEIIAMVQNKMDEENQQKKEEAEIPELIDKIRGQDSSRPSATQQLVQTPIPNIQMNPTAFFPQQSFAQQPFPTPQETAIEKLGVYRNMCKMYIVETPHPQDV